MALPLDMFEITVAVIKDIPASQWDVRSAEDFAEHTADELLQQTGGELLSDRAHHVVYSYAILIGFILGKLKSRGL